MGIAVGGPDYVRDVMERFGIAENAAEDGDLSVEGVWRNARRGCSAHIALANSCFAMLASSVRGDFGCVLVAFVS